MRGCLSVRVCVFVGKSGGTGGHKRDRFDFNGVVEAADKIFMGTIKLYSVCYNYLLF